MVAYLELADGRRFPLDEHSLSLGVFLRQQAGIRDPRVAYNHARISFEPEGWVLRDLDSVNGTTVNGARIRTHRLKEGDRICVGTTELVFHGGEPNPK